MRAYYIDLLTDKVKLTLDASEVKTAYKGLFLTSFKQMKEFCDYGYQSDYDRKYDLTSYTPALKQRVERKEELQKLKETYQEFLDEYASFNLSFEELEKEWQTRLVLARKYTYAEAAYFFPQQNFFDQSFKYFHRFMQYTFDRYGVVSDLNTKRNKKAANAIYKEYLDSDLAKTKDSYKQMQEELKMPVSYAMADYKRFHNEHRLTLRRQNDVKNILLVYLDERQKILDKIREEELLIFAHCKNPPKSCKEIEIGQLRQEDIKFKDTYNVYEVTDTDVKKIVLVEEAYNRNALVNEDGEFVRMKSHILLDTSVTDPSIDLHNTLSFEDPDEYEIDVEARSRDRHMNPYLEDFYGKDLFLTY